MPNSGRVTVATSSTRRSSVAKVYMRTTFDPAEEDYPVQERLFEELYESDPQRYLFELVNPFRHIMGQEMPRDAWSEWDYTLENPRRPLGRRILGEEEVSR
jgi:hypothetical protein